MEFDKIRDLFEDAGYESYSYSGRAMYGAQCLAVTCESPTRCVLEVVQTFVSSFDDDDTAGLQDKLDDLVSSLKDAREDSMGRRTVLYFPGIAWEDDEPGEGESDEDVEGIGEEEAHSRP